jgi:alkylhydroperoxidase family enzyme
MANDTKTAAEKKAADLERVKALFQLRDSSAPGSPEEKAAVKAIAEWIFGG